MQFSLIALAVLYLTPVISGYAVASPQTTPSVPEDDDKALKTLEDAFAVVDAIPDEVLVQGDEATGKWVKEHYQSKGDKTGLEKRLDIKEIAECAYELATNIPAAKVLKVKRLVDRLGGWRAAAKKLLAARRDKKKVVGLIKELIDLILGISGIKKECWDDLK
jgi:hypothetical protein